jgi:putative NADH-flavin reductase
MKIAILGSTGFVGKELLKKSIEKGHQIKVLVRNPNKLGELKEKVEVIEGDYFDKDKVEKAVTGTDIVISAIGPSTKKRESTEKYESAITNLTEIMKKEKIKRIILIGGAATPVKENEKFNSKQKFLSFMLNLMGKYVIQIKSKECAILANSGLDWIIVRPPRITEGSPANSVMADEQNLHCLQIDVADLTDFMLDQTTSNVWLHKAPLVCAVKK